MANRTKWTPKKEQQFIHALADQGTVSLACETCKIARQTAYDHREANPAFRAAWDEALQVYIEKLEAEADRRAIQGVERLKFYQGEPVTDEHGETYKEREYSDTLLMFRLKALDPEKYRERSETKHTFEPVDWSTVPAEIRDAFIDKRLTLAEVHHILATTRRGA